MNLVAYFFFFLAALSLVDWLRRGRHESHRLSRFPVGWVATMCTLGGLFYIPTFRADMAAARAGDAMSALLGEKIRYTCGSAVNTFFDRDTDGAAGYVRLHPDGKPEKNSKLRYDLCRGLVDYLADPNNLQDNQRWKVFAVHALTHESRHMLGELNEAVADCQAIQRNAQTAKALGASEASARELALIYYKSYYLHHPYRHPECRKEGALDENLPSSPWNLK